MIVILKAICDISHSLNPDEIKDGAAFLRKESKNKYIQQF